MFAFPNGPSILRMEFDAALIHLLSFVASKRARSKVSYRIGAATAAALRGVRRF